MVLPVHTTQAVVDKVPFADVLWHDRALDTLAQLILIFTGVLCLLGLMTEDQNAHSGGGDRRSHGPTAGDFVQCDSAG